MMNFIINYKSDHRIISNNIDGQSHLQLYSHRWGLLTVCINILSVPFQKFFCGHVRVCLLSVCLSFFFPQKLGLCHRNFSAMWSLDWRTDPHFWVSSDLPCSCSWLQSILLYGCAVGSLTGVVHKTKPRSWGKGGKMVSLAVIGQGLRMCLLSPLSEDDFCLVPLIPLLGI